MKKLVIMFAMLFLCACSVAEIHIANYDSATSRSDSWTSKENREEYESISHEDVLVAKLIEYWEAEYAGKTETFGDIEISYQMDGMVHIYDDFTGNGHGELFAVMSEGIGCRFWYVDDNSVQLLHSNINGLSPKHLLLFDVGGSKFASFLEDMGNGYFVFLYGVANGAAYETNIPRKGGNQDGHFIINAYGEIEIIGNQLDIIDSRIGRSFKPYYFYLDGSDFREYGGIEITYEQLCQQFDAGDIIGENLPDNAEIQSILYRENGILNINYCESEENNAGKHIYNSNITIRYDGVSSKLEAINMGIYLPALVPEMATYPNL